MTGASDLSKEARGRQQFGGERPREVRVLLRRFHHPRFSQQKNEEAANGPCSIRSLLHVLKTTTCYRSQLEPENDARVVAEVALVVVAASKTVAKASQKKINLRRPNGDRFAQRDVESSTNDEIKGIVARG